MPNKRQLELCPSSMFCMHIVPVLYIPASSCPKEANELVKSTMKNRTVNRDTVASKRLKKMLPCCKYNSGHRTRPERRTHLPRADFPPGERRAS